MKATRTNIVLLSALLTFSASADSYEEHVAYAMERSTSDLSVEKSVTLLGPEFLDEYYPDGEGEKHRIAPKVRVVPADGAANLGGLLVDAGISLTTIYEARVYRKGTKQNVVRIVGDLSDLRNSQFPLLPGDVVVMQRPPKPEA